MASYTAIITSAEVIIAAPSRFVDVPGEKINLMKENAIARETKHATKFGLTLLRWILMGHNYHSLSIDATITVSENCPITGEHVGIIFVTQ